MDYEYHSKRVERDTEIRIRVDGDSARDRVIRDCLDCIGVRNDIS